MQDKLNALVQPTTAINNNINIFHIKNYLAFFFDSIKIEFNVSQLRIL